MFPHILASIIYFVLYAMLLYFAFRYLLTGRYMPTYAASAGHDWGALDAKTQAILEAMARVVGAGMLTTSVTGALLSLGAAITGLAWLKYLAPVPAVVFCAPTLYASYLLRKATRAATPWAPSLAALVLAAAGFALSWM
jgi:alpha-beta hydrolase superfamily lysophospholipase